MALIGPYLPPVIISASCSLMLISMVLIIERPRFPGGAMALALGAAGICLGLMVMNS